MSIYSTDFKIISTNHIVTEAFVNNVKGLFIIDTGASHSCIDINKSEKFKLEYKVSNENASSATQEIRKTFISKKNEIKFGNIQSINNDFILFNMSYIYKTLVNKDEIEIDGLIGANLLIKYKSKIDFELKKIYLKKL